jgi:hypothetical protein
MYFPSFMLLPFGHARSTTSTFLGWVIRQFGSPELFDVLPAVTLRNAVLCDMTLCALVEI